MIFTIEIYNFEPTSRILLCFSNINYKISGNKSSYKLQKKRSNVKLSNYYYKNLMIPSAYIIWHDKEIDSKIIILWIKFKKKTKKKQKG